jgi:hypothetical protein
LYIDNLISGLLLADIAINLHKSSKCEVRSSFKDFMDTATTASSTGAAVFTAFLALAIFVLCLTTIVLLAEEYKSLFSHTEKDKGNSLLSKPDPIPTVTALVLPPVAVALAFVEGRDLTGALHFNGAFMIPFIWLINHHFIQKHEAILVSRLGHLFNKQLSTSFVGCRNITCSWTRGRSIYIMASKLTGMTFSPYACTTYEMC